jgi:hypothetical protein
MISRVCLQIKLPLLLDKTVRLLSISYQSTDSNHSVPSGENQSSFHDPAILGPWRSTWYPVDLATLLQRLPRSRLRNRR